MQIAASHECPDGSALKMGGLRAPGKAAARPPAAESWDTLPPLDRKLASK
jgi:hypothetical protein